MTINTEYNDWQESYNGFMKSMYPIILKYASEIKIDFNKNNNENAKNIITYYSMISKSYDPMTHIFLEESLNKWLLEKGKKII